MADMHTPLANCPFCGGENLEFYYADIDGWIAHVRCIECDDMIGPMSECKYDDKFEAAEDASTKWNRRAPSQDAETIKALREALERTTLLLNAAGKAIAEHGFNMDFTDVDGIETDHIGFSIDCENAVERSRAALAGSAS